MLPVMTSRFHRPVDAPERIVIEGRDGPVTWTRCADCWGLEGEVPAELAEGSRRPDGDVTVMDGAPPETLAPAVHALPVYRTAPGASPAVATGRLFVRLAEGHAATDARDRFAALGLAIADVPKHAPHCAWLAPASGRAADALAELDALRALPDVEHVEPQLLQVRAFK